MSLLAIDWGSVGIKTLQFILSFSILVTIHEFGHFITAKMFGCRVEKFYLFFNPWFSIWKKKIGDTEYGIGWVPFGGYVKIAGMIDESMDKEQMKQPPQPYEFRSKPAWQRLIIMTAGVILNIILALILFIIITYKWGDEYLPPQNVTYGIHADSLGRKMGLQDGDKIIGIDGKQVENFNAIAIQLVLGEAKTLQVERNGKTISLPVPDNLAKQLNQTKLGGFISIRFPVIVDSVDKTKTHFVENELKKNDTLIAINNQYFQFYNEFDSLKKLHPNEVVSLTVLRQGDTVNVKTKLNEKSEVGFIAVSNVSKLFTTVTHHYSFAQSIPLGIERCWQTLGRYITGLKQLFNGTVRASDSLGSVISIGNTFPGVWDWERFWTLTAIFSIILAFMNILPIPALDGGHALFTLIEMITGKKPSDKFMEYAQLAGMILLFALMAYALGLDFMRLFKINN